MKMEKEIKVKWQGMNYRGNPFTFLNEVGEYAASHYGTAIKEGLLVIVKKVGEDKYLFDLSFQNEIGGTYGCLELEVEGKNFEKVRIRRDSIGDYKEIK